MSYDVLFLLFRYPCSQRLFQNVHSLYASHLCSLQQSLSLLLWAFIEPGIENTIGIAHSGGSFKHFFRVNIWTVFHKSSFFHETNIKHSLRVTFLSGQLIQLFCVLIVFVHKVPRVVIVSELNQSCRMVSSRGFFNVIETAFFILFGSYPFFAEQSHKIVGLWVWLVLKEDLTA